MLALDEMQFELLETEDSLVDGYGFGFGLDVSVNDEGFDPGEDDWITQDGVNPTRGTTLFGRDMSAAKTWLWQAHVNQSDVPTALAALAEIKVAWKGRKVASTPGAVQTLRYHIGGRTRRVYGRSRRFSAPPSNRILSGFVPITADFRTVDDQHYADTVSSVTATWSATDDGGFNLPDIMPLHSLPSGTAEGTLTVGGDAPTYPIIRFNGPIANPVFLADTWAIGLNIGLAAGEYVIVDTRPWHLTAIKNGTTNVSGKLNRRQFFEDAVFEPGTHDFAFDGLSSSGGATCAVSWRDAFTSL